MSSGRRYQRLFVDGEWVASTGSGVQGVVNPATEGEIGSVPVASVADVRRAISAARRAFDQGPWGRSTPWERSQLLSRLADGFLARLDELIELNIAEAGAVRALAESTQTRLAIEHLQNWAERAASFPYVEPLPPIEGPVLGQGTILKEPVGVIAAVTPFNYPFYLNLWKLGPALAMGNTVVLKPSPFTPLQAFFIAEVAEEVGFPPGVVNVVTGDEEAGRELTTSPQVDMVSFTGSDVVGRRIMGQAADTLKRLVLELGGKSPNIVLPDADLDRVAPAVAAAFIRHTGQGCGNPTRILVPRELHDELVERICQHLSGVKVGDPADPKVDMGPLIRESQRERVERYVRWGLDDGAVVAFGGGRPAHLSRGYFVEPTLLVGVESSMRVAQDEIFGPVACVIPFRDDDDAVRIANDTRYGLCGNVWSGDPARAWSLARRLRCGMVNVNGGARLSVHGTFGGYKHSGLGVEQSDHGLHEFVQLKTVYWPVGRG